MNEILIKDYPYSTFIDIDNYNLIREVYNGDGGITNIRALQTHVMYDTDDDNLKKLFGWIISFISKSSLIVQKVDHFWFVKYNKGDYTLSHTHDPCLYSFVYFINAPEGSSPLVFTSNNQSVEAKKGRVVIFPASLEHHVPINECENRIILSGNTYFLQPHYEHIRD